eukprot:jgi/Mesen1/995/ME000120S00151
MDHIMPTGLARLSMKATGITQGGELPWNFDKIVLGICVLEKKAYSSPMTAILDRLRAFGEFQIVMFGDKVILEEPVEKWPLCNALVAFHSNGFPLEKAEAYAALRKPYLVNDLESQHLLHDRRQVYAKLEEHGLMTPSRIVVNREFPNQELPNFLEEEDYIEVEGKRIYKPFVEKPANGDDHSIMIYYPCNAGGGMKELFRKIGNRSSEFHPDVRRVRREGSYIYEEFMATGGTDVKVYTVGPDYAHAEARKSPVVDGVVMRSADGKEIRYPVLLTPYEKEMAREVCLAFGQAVCGFDLLRSNGKSFVCDVNGWSFVKNSHKYYDDAACVLRGMLISTVAPHLYSPLPNKLPWSIGETSPDFTRQSSVPTSTFGQREELRCVIAVIRHGDRTPKQKVKLKVTQDRLLDLMLKYNGGRPRAEAKLKSAVQLQDLLDALRMLVPSVKLGRDSDSEAEDFENAEKLRHVKAVLEEGGHFSGIYRKAQLKPQKWAMVHKEDVGAEGGPNGSGGPTEERPTEALMVLKYGGVLTHAGRKQAEELGRTFRNNMYPVEAGEGTGLIRLHSTYRHDLKIYSSDEGRVQMSAAAFAKGLLDLEGQLTPILVSLVSKDSPMLDGLDTASEDIEKQKKSLYEIMTRPDGSLPQPASPEKPWLVDGGGLPPSGLALLKRLVRTYCLVPRSLPLLSLPVLVLVLVRVQEQVLALSQRLVLLLVLFAGVAELTRNVTAQVKELCKDEEDAMVAGGAPPVQEAIPSYDTARLLGKARLDEDRIAAGLPCGTEGFLLMFARWKKLDNDIYNERKDRYNISKVPDIYDSCKYDLLHNQHLKLTGLDDLYNVVKEPSVAPGCPSRVLWLSWSSSALADGVIPNEYGINPQSKVDIGSKDWGMSEWMCQIAHRLLGKILIDMQNTLNEAVEVGMAMEALKGAPKGRDREHLTRRSTMDDLLRPHPRRTSSDKRQLSESQSQKSDKGSDEDSDIETSYRLDPK